jgi:hypothetical protein
LAYNPRRVPISLRSGAGQAANTRLGNAERYGPEETHLVLSDISQSSFRPAWIAAVTCIVLTAIFWGNLFRFSPALMDPVYDTTYEAFVVGRLARAAADGYFNNTDLGVNIDPKNPPADGQAYQRQIEYFEHPDLIHSLGLTWAPYPSHFAFQGYLFAAIDAINPMPRAIRIAFYHLLASLFTAGVLVWMAAILRAKFGWAAFIGFLLPTMIEPMFSAIAPGLGWFLGSCLFPIPFGMLLADEDNVRRRRMLLALAFLAFLVRFLSGYEFTSTIILATAAGCLLTVMERPNLFRHVLRNASWVVAVGVTAFIIAAIMHSAKEGGFTVFAQKAANRMIGDSPSLEDSLIFGKFQPIGAVISLYLGGNYITLVKSFGFVLAAIAMFAVMTLLDERFNWFYGVGRRKLQVLGLAVLASFTAPLSWFVLGKAHSFDHLPFDLIMWYVPTIPLGFAMLAVGSVSIVQYLKLKRGDALLSLLVASIPVVIVGAAVAIRLVDKRIETAGTWVITEHANAVPIYENPSTGIEFRMTNQWFTLLYRCASRPLDWIFQIEANQDGKTVDYSFEIYRKQVLASGGTCIAAQAKSDKAIAQLHLGEVSNKGSIWNRDVTVSLPDTFSPASLSNPDWDRGISRGATPELILDSDTFGRLLIKTGDQILISPADRRTIVSATPFGNSMVVKLDGAPIRLPEGQAPVFGIVRK